MPSTIGGGAETAAHGAIPLKSVGVIVMAAADTVKSRQFLRAAQYVCMTEPLEPRRTDGVLVVVRSRPAWHGAGRQTTRGTACLVRRSTWCSAGEAPPEARGEGAELVEI